MNLLIQITILLLLVSLQIIGLVPQDLDKDFVAFIISLIAFGLFSFYSFKRENVKLLKGQYLKMSNIFLLGFIIVHFQLYIDYLFNNVSSSQIFFWIDTTIGMRAIVIASMALTSYLLGYSLMSLRPVQNLTRRNGTKKLIDFQILKVSAMILLATYILTLNPLYLQETYRAVEAGEIANLSAFLFEAVAFALILLNARNLIILNNSKISFWQYLMTQKALVVLLCLYFGTLFLSGNRGPIIYFTLALGFGFLLLTNKRVSLGRLFMGLFVGSFIISLLGISRQIEATEFTTQISIAVNENLEGRYGNSISENTKELAGSIRTLHMAISNVPSKVDHTNGLLAVQNFALLIPTLEGRLIESFNIPHYYTSSPNFLTWLDQGQFARSGVGTTCVADIYLDFGVPGVVLLFSLFGYFSRSVDLMIVNRNLSIVWLVLAFLFYSFSIYISRSSMFFPISLFTYVFVFASIPFLMNKSK